VTDASAASFDAIRVRRARIGDLAALLAMEQAVFTVDHLSRRSFRHFLLSANATFLVAEESGALAGYALVLSPPRSKLARLYSIAVAPHLGGPRRRAASPRRGGGCGEAATPPGDASRSA
jgi:N-acetylglutamate synthase-like GNAT family acetyltransferase